MTDNVSSSLLLSYFVKCCFTIVKSDNHIGLVLLKICRGRCGSNRPFSPKNFISLDFVSLYLLLTMSIDRFFIFFPNLSQLCYIRLQLQLICFKISLYFLCKYSTNKNNKTNSSPKLNSNRFVFINWEILIALM